MASNKRVQNELVPAIETVWGMPDGLVYFIRADLGQGNHDAFVKVGFTAGNPTRRLKALQTGCPIPLKLLGSTPATKGAESEIHKVLADDRVSGEWFRLSPYCREVVANCIARGAQ